jgi:predicted RND superfamily exporter protein
MEQSEIQDMIAELSATRQWTALAIEWIHEIQQDFVPGELTPDKVTNAIQTLRRQRDELKKELETLKCLQESDHRRSEKWVKIADELRKESEQRKDLVIQLENIIGIAYEASKEALGKN